MTFEEWLYRYSRDGIIKRSYIESAINYGEEKLYYVLHQAREQINKEGKWYIVLRHDCMYFGNVIDHNEYDIEYADYDNQEIKALEDCLRKIHKLEGSR